MDDREDARPDGVPWWVVAVLATWGATTVCLVVFFCEPCEKKRKRMDGGAPFTHMPLSWWATCCTAHRTTAHRATADSATQTVPFSPPTHRTAATQTGPVATLTPPPLPTVRSVRVTPPAAPTLSIGCPRRPTQTYRRHTTHTTPHTTTHVHETGMVVAGMVSSDIAWTSVPVVLPQLPSVQLPSVPSASCTDHSRLP